MARKHIYGFFFLKINISSRYCCILNHYYYSGVVELSADLDIIIQYVLLYFTGLRFNIPFVRSLSELVTSSHCWRNRWRHSSTSRSASAISLSVMSPSRTTFSVSTPSCDSLRITHDTQCNCIFQQQRGVHDDVVSRNSSDLALVSVCPHVHGNADPWSADVADKVVWRLDFRTALGGKIARRLRFFTALAIRSPQNAEYQRWVYIYMRKHLWRICHYLYTGA